MVAKEEVLGFDIPVNHVLLVAVNESVGHLLDVLRRPRLFKPRHRLELLVELSLRSKPASKKPDEESGTVQEATHGKRTHTYSRIK